MNAEEIALQGEILRTVVGSTVHGLQLPDQDDRDEMGVCIEPPEYLLGLSDVKHGLSKSESQGFEQYVFRTQPEGVRSGPGDVDLVIYSLRKYLRLVLAGNPTVLLPLFARELDIIVHTPIGDELRHIGPQLLSRQCGERFLKYLQAQRERVEGQRGQARLPDRPELVAAHGYDTKYAAHMIRLGYQGEELLQTGRLTLPMKEPVREWILGIREGKVSFEEVMVVVRQLEVGLEKLTKTSDLPPEPDLVLANNFLVNAYQRHWRQNGLI
jgi:hypothetical protein